MDRFMMMTTYVQVVKNESFISAARTLGISRSLVSRHIAELETHLGMRLLNRTTRSISMTEAGRDYYEFCSRVLDDIQSIEGEIIERNHEAEGALAVIVPKWIGSLDIADAVTAFSRAHPKIRVSLELGGMSSKTYDFIERGFDVALQTREIPDSLVKVRRIATLKYALVATPVFLEQCGRPEHPADLAKMACIAQTYDQTWRFDGGDAEGEIKVRGDVVFSSNTYLVLRKAVLADLGLGLLPLQLVHTDIENGALEQVMPKFPPPERPLYAMIAPGGPPPRKVRAFTDFLANWLKDHPLAK